jgi:hypothetical protein
VVKDFDKASIFKTKDTRTRGILVEQSVTSKDNGIVGLGYPQISDSDDKSSEQNIKNVSAKQQSSDSLVELEP